MRRHPTSSKCRLAPEAQTLSPVWRKQVWETSLLEAAGSTSARTRVHAGFEGAAMASKEKKTDIVQVKNPKTGHYVKIDRDKGKILNHKKSEGPYKGVPIARKRKAG